MTYKPRSKNIHTKGIKKLEPEPVKLLNICCAPHVNSLILCGDIKTCKSWPMPNVLKDHPTTHKRKAKTYFIPNTIKLHPKYKHLTKKFSPLLKHIHPLHHHISLTLPHLHEYIQQKTTNFPTSQTLDHGFVAFYSQRRAKDQLTNVKLSNVITYP